MLKTSVALTLMLATTIPAFAADKVVSRHEVRYQDQIFICGEVKDKGRIRRYIHSIPEAKYIPELEPRASDPLAKSWLITYRILCEKDHVKPNLTARLNRKRY